MKRTDDKTLVAQMRYTIERLGDGDTKETVREATERLEELTTGITAALNALGPVEDDDGLHCVSILERLLKGIEWDGA